MSSTRAPPKQPKDAVEDTQSKRLVLSLLQQPRLCINLFTVLGDSVGIHQSWTERRGEDHQMATHA